MHAVWAPLLLGPLLGPLLGTMTSVAAIKCLHLHPQGVLYDVMTKNDFLKLCLKASKEKEGAVPPCEYVECGSILAADQCVARATKNKDEKWESSMGCMEKTHQSFYEKGIKKTSKQMVYVCDETKCNEPKKDTEFMKKLKEMVKAEEEESTSTTTIILIVTASALLLVILLAILGFVAFRATRPKQREYDDVKEEPSVQDLGKTEDDKEPGKKSMEEKGTASEEVPAAGGEQEEKRQISDRDEDDDEDDADESESESESDEDEDERKKITVIAV